MMADLKNAEIRILKRADILKCPFVILMPEHYRADGTCKCDDPEHRQMMIREWGYSKRAFAKIPLRGEAPDAARDAVRPRRQRRPR